MEQTAYFFGDQAKNVMAKWRNFFLGCCIHQKLHLFVYYFFWTKKFGFLEDCKKNMEHFCAGKD